MKIEDARKKRKRSRGPKVDSNTHRWPLNEILVALHNKDMFVCHRFQRPPSWDTVRQISYIIDLNQQGIIQPVYVASVSKCAAACLEEFAAEDESYKYFVNLEKQGYKWIILDGQNRLGAIENFLNNTFKISNCTLSAADDEIKDYDIDEKGLFFKDLPVTWQKRLKKTEVPFIILTEATTEDLHFEFIKLNTGEHLNHQEKRNAVPTRIANKVRAMAMAPAQDVCGAKLGKFYKDFLELFGTTNAQRRGTDHSYLKLIALTQLIKESFVNGKRIDKGPTRVQLNEPALDKMYFDDNTPSEIYSLVEQTTTLAITLAKCIKEETGKQLRFQEFITVYLFVLVTYGKGYKIDIKNADENMIKKLAKKIYNDEPNREAHFQIPEHLRATRSDYTDSAWTKIKKEYSYEYWRELTSSPTAMISRYGALDWTFDRIVADENFEKILTFSEKKTPRANISITHQRQLAQRQDYRCRYTGVRFDISDIGQRIEVDHLIPLSRGGSNDEENLAMVLKEVNRTKGVRNVHRPITIAKDAHPEVYADYHASLPTSQCLHKAYEDEVAIHYLVIDVKDTHFWINIRERYREEETPKLLIPQMTFASSPSMQANV
jgi:hypothetical protein